MTPKQFILSLLFLAGLAVIVFGSAQTNAGSPIVDIRKPLVVVGAITDKGKKLKHNELAELNDAHFTDVGDIPALGFSPARHWIKVRVFNFDDRKAGRILERKKSSRASAMQSVFRNHCSLPTKRLTSSSTTILCPSSPVVL